MMLTVRKSVSWRSLNLRCTWTSPVSRVHGQMRRNKWDAEREGKISHLDQPVDEDRAHLVVDVILSRHVVRRRREIHLLAAEVGIDVLDVVSDCHLVIPATISKRYA